MQSRHRATNLFRPFVRAVVLCAATTTALACSTGPGEPLDDRNDSFVAPADGDGKADGQDGIESLPEEEKRGVLALANEADYTELDEEVALDARAASGIVDYRHGDDLTPGTDDDRTFETLEELDAIPYVGPYAFEQMLQYARANGYVDDPSGCTSHSDCGRGEVCSDIYDECVEITCEFDHQCNFSTSTDRICRNGQCFTTCSRGSVDCPSGYSCDMEAGVCYIDEKEPCSSDRDCLAAHLCDSRGRCVECEHDWDCGTDELCTDKGACEVETFGECTSDDDCPNPGQPSNFDTCRTETEECVACLTDQDCRYPSFCTDDFYCRQDCRRSDGDCPNSGDHCDWDTGSCVECKGDFHCPGYQQCHDGYCS